MSDAAELAAMERLAAMVADDQDTWDLSPKDAQALREVREHVYALRAELGQARAEWGRSARGNEMALRELQDVIGIINDDDGPPDDEFALGDAAEAARAIVAERDALAEKVKGLEADIVAASGELMVDVPVPGTEMARVMLANAMMRRERDFTAEQVRAWEAIAERDHGHPLPCNAAAIAAKLVRVEDTLKFYAHPRQWCSMGHGAYADIGTKARNYFASAAKESTDGGTRPLAEKAGNPSSVLPAVVQSELARGPTRGPSCGGGGREATSPTVETAALAPAGTNPAASSPVEQKCAYCGEMVDAHHDYRCVRSHSRPKTDVQAEEEKCAHCDGTGEQWCDVVSHGSGRATCPTCNGTGIATVGEGER